MLPARAFAPTTSPSTAPPRSTPSSTAAKRSSVDEPSGLGGFIDDVIVREREVVDGNAIRLVLGDALEEELFGPSRLALDIRHRARRNRDLPDDLLATQQL